MIIDGEVDPDRPALKLAGKLDGVEISPEMRNVLTEALGCDLSMLGSLRGQTEAHFKVAMIRPLPSGGRSTLPAS